MNTLVLKVVLWMSYIARAGQSLAVEFFHDLATGMGWRSAITSQYDAMQQIVPSKDSPLATKVECTSSISERHSTCTCLMNQGGA